MSKRNLEGENDENEARKKYAFLKRFSEKTTSKTLRRLNIKEI